MDEYCCGVVCCCVVLLIIALRSDVGGERDAFGISYQPFNKKSLGYEMPKGPAVEDELEFEHTFQSSALLQSSSVPAQDDEFDFDSDAGDGDGIHGSQDLITQALERVALMALQEAEAEAAVVGISNNDPIGADVATIATTDDTKPIARDTKFDVRKAARESFNEIASIYGAGLGDIEVRLLDHDTSSSGGHGSGSGSSINSGTTSASLLGKPLLSVTETIEECDEEELEREEQLAEEREQIEVAQQMSREAELAAAFDALAVTEDDNSDNGGQRNVKDAGDAIRVVEYHATLAELRLVTETRDCLFCFVILLL